MNRLRNLSMGGKILLLIMGITGVALLSAGVFLGIHERHDAKQAMVEELTVLARVVADRSTAALSFGDRKVATENLSALAANHSIDAACLYTADGALFAFYHRRARCQPPFAGGAYHFDADSLHIRQPVLCLTCWLMRTWMCRPRQSWL